MSQMKYIMSFQSKSTMIDDTSQFLVLMLSLRCYIMNRKARQAWELYLKMETSAESFSLLQLIANDCYKTGQFYYASKVGT